MAKAGAIRAGRAFVELFADDRKLVRGLRNAQRRLRAFGAGVRQIGQRMLVFGAAAAAPFALATRTFAQFDDQMRIVRAVTGATQDQFAALTEEAKRLGRTTSFTASQVAAAMVELGRAGFRPDAILNSTEAVLALARATATELPRATEIAGAALRGFNLQAEDMGRVSDVLVAGANKSAQTLEDLFEAFKMVAPIAAEAGASIEETVAAIGIMANNGIKGSLAGTALARAYKNLAQEIKQAELAKIGVEATDAAGNLRPITDILNDIARATSNLGSAQRLSIFETLFGRGQAAALKLAGGATAFDTLLTEIRSASGIAQKTAAEMDAGIGGSFRKLLSAVEGVAIAIGDAIADTVSTAADALQKVAGWITLLVEKNQSLVVGVVIGIAAFTAFGAALIAFGFIAQGLAAVLGLVAGAFTVLSTVIGGAITVIAAIASPVGIAVGALTVLGAAILHWTGAGGAAIDWLGQRFGALRGFVSDVASGIADALAAGDIGLAAKVLWAGLKLAWQQGTQFLEEAWINFTSSFQMLGVEAFAAVQRAWVQVRDFFESNFPQLTAFISKSWSVLMESLRTGVQQLIEALTTAILLVQAIFDDELDVKDVLRSQAQKMSQIQQESLDRLAEKFAEADRRAGRTDTEREAEKQAALDAIEQQRAAALVGLEDDREEKVRAAGRELADARAELEAARAEARRARSERGFAAGGAAPGSDPFDPQAVQDALADGAQQITRGAIGSFDAAALERLSFGVAAARDSATERTAEATEQSLDWLQNIFNNITDLIDVQRGHPAWR